MHKQQSESEAFQVFHLLPESGTLDGKSLKQHPGL